MESQEWSRSRFWLAHFVHSRHDRPAIEWHRPVALGPLGGQRLVWWLTLGRSKPVESGAWLVARAVHDWRDDPWFVQALRLMVTEQRHHEDLLERLAVRWGAGGSSDASGHRMTETVHRILSKCRRRCLGPRFEMSVWLLKMVGEHALLRLIAGAMEDEVVRSVCRVVAQEKRAHIAFLVERLTMLYADFNFIRRNLRRLRLRMMWGVISLSDAMGHRRLLDTVGSTRLRFLWDGFRRFAQLLEQMVPYRRDALLASLRMQQQDRYAKPRLR